MEVKSLALTPIFLFSRAAGQQQVRFR